MTENLTEIFSRDVPEGAQVSGAREEALPARTWINLGDGDGTEIYLDAGENVRALVRTVRTMPAACAEPVWDGPYKMTCGLTLVDGKCGRHGR